MISVIADYAELGSFFYGIPLAVGVLLLGLCVAQAINHTRLRIRLHNKDVDLVANGSTETICDFREIVQLCQRVTSRE